MFKLDSRLLTRIQIRELLSDAMNFQVGNFFLAHPIAIEFYSNFSKRLETYEKLGLKSVISTL